MKLECGCDVDINGMMWSSCEQHGSKSAPTRGSAHSLKVGLKFIDHVQGTNMAEWECPECEGHYFFGNFIKTKPVCNGDETATAY